MNYDELSETWRQQMPRDPAGLPNDDKLFDRVRCESARFDRTILWRDVREVAAGVFVAAVFGGVSREMPGRNWLVWLAIILVLGVTGWMVVARRRLQKRRARIHDDTMRGELEWAVEHVRAQIALLENVLWWYFLPLGAAALLFALEVVLRAPLPLWAAVVTFAVMVAIVGLVNWGAWLLNRRAVSHGLRSRLQELEEMRRAFEGAGGNGDRK